MYNNVQVIKNRFGFDRIEAKGNTSLLDDALRKKVAVIGCDWSTSHAKTAAISISDNISKDDNYILVGRLVHNTVAGLDETVFDSVLDDSNKDIKHRIIAITTNINYLNNISKRIIKHNGLIISPISNKSTSSPKLIMKETIIPTSISKTYGLVAILLAKICDAIIICDMDRFSKYQTPYDPTNRLKDPYLELVFGLQYKKKIYFTSGMSQSIIDQFGLTRGKSTPEIKSELDKLLYATPSS